MKTYMRKYCIFYWAEINDEATDVEKYIEANNIVEALNKFLEHNIRYKRIESIKEVVHRTK